MKKPFKAYFKHIDINNSKSCSNKINNKINNRYKLISRPFIYNRGIYDLNISSNIWNKTFKL